MSGENKVTVKVEVVVEGAGGPVRVATAEPPCAAMTAIPRVSIRPLSISYPGLSVPGPVYPWGSGYCVEAGGMSLPSSTGSYPRKVWGLVYPDPSWNPPDKPPSGAVPDTPQSDYSWSFTRSKSNPLPVTVYGTQASGSPNNTLAVWYDYGTGPDSKEYTPFYAYLIGSGGSAGGPPCLVHGEPALLYATFTGPLASLGSVALVRSGAGWVGASAAYGGCALTFVQAGGVGSLVSSGPGVLFLVSGPSHSFPWSATGTASGLCSGPFTVTITE